MPLKRRGLLGDGACAGTSSLLYHVCMFTGIVQALGCVRSVTPTSGGRSLLVDPEGWRHVPSLGDSIAVNGCCLTLVEVTGEGCLRFDVIYQTLRMTTLGLLGPNDPVNLEYAVTPTTLLGGHIVLGHVDGVAEVVDVRSGRGEHRLTITPPAELMEFIIPKGSVAIDGVSLTLAEVGATNFEVALIPTTLALTNLGRLGVGSRVNVETDTIAKTVIHHLKYVRDDEGVSRDQPRAEPGAKG